MTNEMPVLNASNSSAALYSSKLKANAKDAPGPTGTANRVVYGLRCLPCVSKRVRQHGCYSRIVKIAAKPHNTRPQSITGSAAVGTAHLYVPGSSHPCLHVRKKNMNS